MKPETKQWLKIAEGDYEVSLYGFKMARYPQALYLLCQAIEKLLKGAQIEFANLKPPRSHRLENLARKTKLSFSDKQYDFLIELSQHYGRVRYPDYSQVDYSNKMKVSAIFNNGQKIYLWILNKLTNH